MENVSDSEIIQLHLEPDGCGMFSAESLPWTDTGQETGYLPEKRSRFYAIEIVPIPHSIDEPQN